MADAIIQTRLYTADEFEQIAGAAEHADQLLELIHGEIVEKVPTEEHGVIAATLARYIGNFIESLELGRVGVEVRYRKPGDKYNARMPDVSFRSAATTLVKQGAVSQMPDFAIEIQSPDDQPREMREKARYYLQNGSRLVWLLYPSERKIEVCTWNAESEMDVQTATENDTVDGGSVLPGFTLPVKKIFPK